MKRTLSIGSRVPPAVTSTRTPVQASGMTLSKASQAASSSAGSASRPIPCSPWEASSPSPGGITTTPAGAQRLDVGLGGRVAHIWSFIAGATSTGHGAASAAALSRLSAWPWASLASVFALAGAIR